MASGCDFARSLLEISAGKATDVIRLTREWRNAGLSGGWPAQLVSAYDRIIAPLVARALASTL
jgi:hypothetical protein